MISAAVASIILIASYACLSAGVSAQRMIEPRTEAMQSARVALAMMTSDLRSACSLSTNFDFVGGERMIGEMDADNLDFATRHYMPKRPTEGDYCQISYYIEKSRDGKQYSLWRRRNPHIALDPLEGGIEDEIVPGVKGFTLEYYDGLDWYDTWGDANVKKKTKYTDVEKPNMSGFPAAVRITLLLENASGKTSKTAKVLDKTEAAPPFAFQTVVRLEMAEAQGAGGMSAGDSGQTPGGRN